MPPQISNDVIQGLFPEASSAALKITSVSLPTDLVAIYDSIAAKSNRSRSEVIAALTRVGLKQFGLLPGKK